MWTNFFYHCCWLSQLSFLLCKSLCGVCVCVCVCVCARAGACVHSCVHPEWVCIPKCTVCEVLWFLWLTMVCQLMIGVCRVQLPQSSHSGRWETWRSLLAFVGNTWHSKWCSGGSEGETAIMGSSKSQGVFAVISPSHWYLILESPIWLDILSHLPNQNFCIC